MQQKAMLILICLVFSLITGSPVSATASSDGKTYACGQTIDPYVEDSDAPKVLWLNQSSSSGNSNLPVACLEMKMEQPSLVLQAKSTCVRPELLTASEVESILGKAKKHRNFVRYRTTAMYPVKSLVPRQLIEVAIDFKYEHDHCVAYRVEAPNYPRVWVKTKKSEEGQK